MSINNFSLRSSVHSKVLFSYSFQVNSKSYVFRNFSECNLTNDSHIESPVKLVEIQIAGPHPQSFRFSQLGLGLDVFLF